MNILLLGYGKMGQLIEQLALKNGHTILAKINSGNRSELADIDPKAIDVAIEFSNPDAVIENIKWCFDKTIPVVVGTTGWQEFRKEIDDLCQSTNGTYLYASNFSLGVNLFFKVNQVLAKLMDKHPDYDPQMREIHHTQKLDSPSGTAVTLAEGIISEMVRKSSWTENSDHKHQEIYIKSERADPTPGTHIIQYDSEIDSIEIRHTAHSRVGFAKGALSVAEWIIGKDGILTMDDYLGL